MSTNQQILLDALLSQTKNSLYPELSDSEFFHLYVSEQILKDLELSYDEVEEGIVDNGGDGGIDAIYTFVNNELIQRDSDLMDGKRNSVIDVYLIQSKATSGFKESAIEKCNSSAIDLFDLSKSIDELRAVYNNELLKNVEIFRKQYINMAAKLPSLRFHYFYATKGVEVHQNTARKVEMLKYSILNHFDRAEVNFEFVTAQKLIDLSRREQIRSKEVVVQDNPISTQDGGYIAIIPIKNYHDFITNDDGHLIKYFFDANIRDYQVNVEVNKEIRRTLAERDTKEDFWWLNNGVTITAADATFASKRLYIEDPQIVNGLQTSFEIHKYFTENKVDNEPRNILLRVIKVQDEKSRLKVIKATNSQTNIPPASLRATDPIHRDIEDYLFHKGYYYDRRKNYHKNQGRPTKKIIGIPYLAQIVMSVFNQKPDYARARPSTLIKNNSDYTQIFSSDIPIELYYKVIEIQKIVESSLKDFQPYSFTRAEIGDLRFHVSMYLTCRLTDSLKPRKDVIASIDIEEIPLSVVNEAIENTQIIYDSLGGNDSVAKGREIVAELLELLSEKISKYRVDPPN